MPVILAAYAAKGHVWRLDSAVSVNDGLLDIYRTVRQQLDAACAVLNVDCASGRNLHLCCAVIRDDLSARLDPDMLAAVTRLHADTIVGKAFNARRQWPKARDKECVVRIVKASQRVACHASGLRSEEHTSELQSRGQLVCRLLRDKKNKGTLED